MAGKPRLLIFDEPTKGIDVGTKTEIYRLMKKLAEEEEIGTYTIAVSNVGGMKMNELSLSIHAAVGAEYFMLTYDDGKPVGSAEPVPLDGSLRYLTMLASSIEEVQVVLYDASQNEICTAHLRESGQTVWRSSGE